MELNLKWCGAKEEEDEEGDTAHDVHWQILALYKGRVRKGEKEREIEREREWVKERMKVLRFSER